MVKTVVLKRTLHFFTNLDLKVVVKTMVLKRTPVLRRAFVPPSFEEGTPSVHDFWSCFRGRKKYRKSGSRGSPKGPQKSTKIDKKRVLEGSRKGTSKWDPLQDQEK